MKRSLTPLISATTIAVGISAITSEPSQAAANYSYEPYANSENWAYGSDRLQLPSLGRAYQRGVPAYHYAYYSIARPEYLL